MYRMYGRNVFSCRNVNLYEKGYGSQIQRKMNWVPVRICMVHMTSPPLPPFFSNMGLVVWNTQKKVWKGAVLCSKSVLVRLLTLSASRDRASPGALLESATRARSKRNGLQPAGRLNVWKRWFFNFYLTFLNTHGKPSLGVEGWVRLQGVTSSPWSCDDRADTTSSPEGKARQEVRSTLCGGFQLPALVCVSLHLVLGHHRSLPEPSGTPQPCPKEGELQENILSSIMFWCIHLAPSLRPPEQQGSKAALWSNHWKNKFGPCERWFVFSSTLCGNNLGCLKPMRFESKVYTLSTVKLSKS